MSRDHARLGLMGIRNDPKLADWLAEQKWSKFAQSLAHYYDYHGFLTDRQHAAAVKLRESVEGSGSPEKKPDTRAE